MAEDARRMQQAHPPPLSFADHPDQVSDEKARVRPLGSPGFSGFGRNPNTQVVNPMAKGAAYMAIGGRKSVGTYSQALSIARAQAAARVARSTSPKSPRRRKVMLEAVPGPDWYDPGKTKLKEVFPRKVLDRNIEIANDMLGRNKFTSSETHVNVQKLYENCLEKKVLYNLDVHSPNMFPCGHARVEHLNGENYEEQDSDGSEEESSGNDEDDEQVSEMFQHFRAKEVDRRGSIWGGAIKNEEEGVTAVERLIRRGSRHGDCNPKNHTPFLRDQVYAARCEEVHVKGNSAVMGMLSRCLEKEVCYCSLSEVSFANYGIGDRGLPALLPLLTFGRRLKSLNLSGNGLHSEATKQLCALLGDLLVLSTLLVLDLSANPLGYSCSEELSQLLTQRKGILLMLGLKGTQLRPRVREDLMNQSLNNFATAEYGAMDQALRYSRRPGAFQDMDLRLRCTQILACASAPSSPRGSSGGGAGGGGL